MTDACYCSYDEGSTSINGGVLFLPVLLDKAADEIEALRAQVAQYKEDAERLHYVLRRLPGSILRSLIGTMSDTGDIDEFRAAIDKARKA